ncbi:PAS domain-containing sensor histidine kinase [Nafulsella turpanensis]|uniref:PAS domain-containing sensor histidine kinase n=1 Tax=Nafulsella turpanensis TaxID=1265690 RepID=UPI00034991D2|nr:PAS domain-containing sensor histidine kinase [Nafulsella turpanensis]
MELSKNIRAWEKIVNSSPDIINTIDKEGITKNTNGACKNILGYEDEEIIGYSVSSFIHPEDLIPSLEILHHVINGERVRNFKNRCFHKNGQEVTIEWSVVWSEEDQVFLCVGRDITQQELAQQKLQEKDEFYQTLAEHGSDLLIVFDDKLNYKYCGSSISKELGYEPEQLIGKNAFHYIHPEDSLLIKESLSEILDSGDSLKVSEFRFKDANGDWRWLELTASNQLHNPAINGLVVNSRDITERIHHKLKLQESTERFKSLFDNNLDMVFLQNKEGVVLDVNIAALSFLGVQREDLVGRPLYELLSEEVIMDFGKGLQTALNGESVHFESAVPFEEKKNYIFDIATIPVVVNGDIIGVYCVFRDITELVSSHRINQQQTEKLHIILESITDAFFALDRNWNFTYVNSEFEKLIGEDREKLLGENVCDFSQEILNGEFFRKYSFAVKEEEVTYYETYYEPLDKWLALKSYPSEEGLSVFITDVTEKVKAKKELEKLSLVASKTTNGVIIMDAEGKTEWVNDGFSKLTGHTLSDMVGKRPDTVLRGAETDRALSDRIGKSLERKKSHTEEALVYKKSGGKVWLNLNITPVLDEKGSITRFVTIQTDITERKAAEENQNKLTKDLYRQNSDLQQFTYIVSHNLRAPVANAMGLVDLITEVDPDSENFPVFIDYLKSSVYKMDTVLKDLNTILSIRDKKGTVHKEKVQLLGICQQAIEELQEPLKSCGGEVLMNIEESICVNGNKAYLYSVFYNLLSNAIKYRSPERPLKVDIKCFGSKERGTILSFTDNGSGFDRKTAGKDVFKLYKRFHTHSEGRGIGLFLVRTHLEAMGGHIEVSSQLNVGTRFLIYLR